MSFPIQTKTLPHEMITYQLQG